MTSLSDLHNRFDGPVPAEELAKLAQQAVRTLEQTREAIRRERGNVRHEIREFRKIQKRLADPTLSEGLVARLWDEMGVIVMSMDLARKRHGRLCARLRKMLADVQPVPMRKAA